MNSGLLTIIREVLPDVLECGGKLTKSPAESPVPDLSAGLAMAHRPAAALDSATHPRSRCCSQGKAPSPQRAWGLVPKFPANAPVSPVAEVRFDRATLPPHSKTARNP